MSVPAYIAGDSPALKMPKADPYGSDALGMDAKPLNRYRRVRDYDAVQAYHCRLE